MILHTHLTNLLILHQALSDCKGAGVREHAWVESVLGWTNYYELNIDFSLFSTPYPLWLILSADRSNRSVVESTLLDVVALFIMYKFVIPYKINVLPLNCDETVQTWSAIMLKLLNCLFILYPYYTTCIYQHLLHINKIQQDATVCRYLTGAMDNQNM